MWQYGKLAAVAALLTVSLAGTALAETSSSENYRVTETQFGAGSQRGCTDTYCAKASIGDNVVGRSSSENYSAQFGSNTTKEPLLEVITEDVGEQNLGVLDIDRTATATQSVKVRSYLSNGYIIQVAGDTPNQGTHSLAPIETPSTSHQGAEQFGINLVANENPEVGANPQQVPSSEVSFGYVTDDYSQADLFKYLNGDIVARSDRSTGETHYTMSIIMNVSNSTPSGRYNGAFSAIVVPMY